MTLEHLWDGSRAVLFDFDGVLADSEPFYRLSWNRVLAAFNHSVSEQDYWKYWAWLGTGLAGEIERSGVMIEDPLAAKESQKKIYTDYCMSDMIPLFPAAADTLRRAAGLRKCAIASNTDSLLVKRIARSAGKFLPPVVGGEGLRPKPAPDIFLRAAELLGVLPEECLVFEDALKGVRAAREADMQVVLVRNRYNSSFPAPGISHEIDGIGTLATFLKGRTNAG